jgi:ubiquinone/menaquinone biosynthesis C-methylase UbiE
MDFTGERVVPGKVEPDLWNEHLSRYYFAQPLMAGRAVLDIGCGTGYGAAILANTSETVWGVDISSEAIGFARQNYPRTNLHFLVADCLHLGLKSESVEGIVCFEVIEHLLDQDTFLGELRRVLREDGLAVISTPNRVFYTEESNQANPFHTREFDFEEFNRYLRNYFARVEICYQNHVYSVMIGNPGLHHSVLPRFNGNRDNLETTSHFFVAICSKAEVNWPAIQDLVYLPYTGNLLREKQQHITFLESKVRQLDDKVLSLQRQYNEHVLQLQQQNEQLRREFEERSGWAIRVSRELSERDAQLLTLQKAFDERTEWALRLQNEFDERTEWALRLKAELEDCRARLERIQQSGFYKLSQTLRLVPRP